MLEVEQFDDLEQVQQIAVMILRKYIKESSIQTAREAGNRASCPMCRWTRN